MKLQLVKGQDVCLLHLYDPPQSFAHGDNAIKAQSFISDCPMKQKPSTASFNSNDVATSETISLCSLFLCWDNPRLNHTKQWQLIFLDVSSIGTFPSKHKPGSFEVVPARGKRIIRLGLQCIFSPGTQHWLLALTCSHQALPNHMCSSPRGFLSTQDRLAGCSLTEMNQKPQRQAINSLFLA